MPTPQYHRASSRRRRRENRSSTDRAADPREPHTRGEADSRDPVVERTSDAKASRTDEAASETVQESESCALLQPARSGDASATDEDVPALLTRRPASP
jgi:hypothetical protein